MTFFKSVLANILSFFIIATLIIGTVVFIVIKLSQPEEVKIKDNSVLHLVLDGELKDQENSQNFSFDPQHTIALTQLETLMEQAAKDVKIKAVFVELKNLHTGVANWERLRSIFITFKKSKKSLICYAENYSLLGYYALSVSDEIVLHPMGYLEWKGLSAQLLYFKSMLDAIGVQAEPIKVGKYKSAIEPYISDSISAENEYQIKELIADIWSKIKSDVSISRKISEVELNEIADSLGVLIASEAKTKKLISTVAHRDHIDTYLKNKFGDFEFAKFSDYSAFLENNKRVQDSKIAIVYADGMITGDDESDEISSEKYQKIFAEIQENKDIKGIVLRINSPGGSASVSESIWQQIKNIKKTMPVYVSMGNLAASGGYYIASAGDSIFAENTTITGSIGVYGLLFNLEALKSKLGVSVEKVKTNHLSDFPAFDRPMSKLERQRMQMGVDSIYYLFLKRVSASRKMSVEQVHELAQGRVWTGSQAQKNGLVDGIKSLHQVIALMGTKLKINNLETIEYPIPQNPLEKIISKIDNKVELKLPEPFSYINEIGKYLEICQNFKRPQCQMPFELSIE
jgi:protease-4